MDFDFIQKLSDDITTVRVFEFPAEHSEPETHGLIEDLNETSACRRGLEARTD